VLSAPHTQASGADQPLAAAYSYIPETVLGDWGYEVEPKWTELEQVCVGMGCCNSSLRLLPPPQIRRTLFHLVFHNALFLSSQVFSKGYAMSYNI
jgi:hypothetical protein